MVTTGCALVCSAPLRESFSSAMAAAGGTQVTAVFATFRPTAETAGVLARALPMRTSGGLAAPPLSVSEWASPAAWTPQELTRWRHTEVIQVGSDGRCFCGYWQCHLALKKRLQNLANETIGRLSVLYFKTLAVTYCSILSLKDGGRGVGVCVLF